MKRLPDNVTAALTSVPPQDENLGLVKLVVEAQTKRDVLRLTQTYITLSLPDIASNVGLPSAEAAELAILRCAACRMGARAGRTLRVPGLLRLVSFATQPSVSFLCICFAPVRRYHAAVS